MSKKSLVLLALFYMCNGILTYSEECNLNRLREKYIHEILEESEDLNKLPRIRVKGEKMVSEKINALNNFVQSQVSNGDDLEFYLTTCLQPTVNNIQLQFTICFDKFVQKTTEIEMYVNNTIDSINRCFIGQRISCESAKMCCRKVIKRFDDDYVEDNVENLEDHYNSCLKKILRYKYDKIVILKCISTQRPVPTETTTLGDTTSSPTEVVENTSFTDTTVISTESLPVTESTIPTRETPSILETTTTEFPVIE